MFYYTQLPVRGRITFSNHDGMGSRKHAVDLHLLIIEDISEMSVTLNANWGLWMILKQTYLMTV